MPVKQLLSLINPIRAARAAAATYSCPLRMTCAGNGGLSRDFGSEDVAAS